MNKRHIQHIKPVNSAQVRSALISLLTAAIPLDWEARDLDDETLWDILLCRKHPTGRREKLTMEIVDQAFDDRLALLQAH